MTTTKLISSELTNRAQQNLAGTLSERFTRAIYSLTEAAHYAESTAADPWDFAVEIDQLRAMGVTNSDLRYLVKLQVIEHAAEATNTKNESRQFKREARLSFTNKSCFVLSHRGPQFVSHEGSVALGTLTLAGTHDEDGKQDSLRLPFWDGECRVLLFRDRIVKQFKRQAVNQEVILSAFQEEGWPRRIDDPLTPQPAIDEKRRLNDAIKSLNRNHQSELVRFHGDGSGQAIVWQT